MIDDLIDEIRSRRLARRWTLSDLSDEAGVPESWLSALELRSSSDVSEEFLKAVWNALKSPPMVRFDIRQAPFTLAILGSGQGHVLTENVQPLAGHLPVCTARQVASLSVTSRRAPDQESSRDDRSQVKLKSRAAVARNLRAHIDSHTKRG